MVKHPHHRPNLTAADTGGVRLNVERGLERAVTEDSCLLNTDVSVDHPAVIPQWRASVQHTQPAATSILAVSLTTGEPIEMCLELQDREKKVVRCWRTKKNGMEPTGAKGVADGDKQFRSNSKGSLC